LLLIIQQEYYAKVFVLAGQRNVDGCEEAVDEEGTSLVIARLNQWPTINVKIYHHHKGF
jgi:hypothetical protein